MICAGDSQNSFLYLYFFFPPFILPLSVPHFNCPIYVLFPFDHLSILSFYLSLPTFPLSTFPSHLSLTASVFLTFHPSLPFQDQFFFVPIPFSTTRSLHTWVFNRITEAHGSISIHDISSVQCEENRSVWIDNTKNSRLMNSLTHNIYSIATQNFLWIQRTSSYHSNNCFLLQILLLM